VCVHERVRALLVLKLSWYMPTTGCLLSHLEMGVLETSGA
jgi:hypothetical protein